MTETPRANTIEAPGEFDALVKLRPGEPYFVLIGRDRFAPGLVLEWVDRNRRRAMEESRAGNMSDDQLHLELRQSTEAEQIAWDMQAFKSGRTEQAAAVVPERRDGTTGNDPRPDELIARDRLVSHRARAVSALHNAIAELNDLAELLPNDGDEWEAAALGLAKLRHVVAELTPKRAALGEK